MQARNENYYQILFQNICQFARDKNFDELTNLVNKGCRLDIKFNEMTPLMVLASENNRDAVIFLINHFKVAKNNAVMSAAQNGHAVLTHELLGLRASPKSAAIGAARGRKMDLLRELVRNNQKMINHAIHILASDNEVALVDQLLDEGAKINYAIFGAAAGGHKILTYRLLNQLKYLNREPGISAAVEGAASANQKELMNNIFDNFGRDLNSAVRGAAAGMHIDLINNLIDQGAAIDSAISSIEKILRKPKDPLKLVVQFKNPELRFQIINLLSLNRFIKLVELHWLAKKSDKVARLIHQYNIDYRYAKDWDPRMHVWILQGYQLVQKRGLPPDIFAYIIATLLKCSLQESKFFINKHRTLLATKLFDISQKKINREFKLGKYTPFFIKSFSPIEKSLQEQQARERYQARLS